MKIHPRSVLTLLVGALSFGSGALAQSVRAQVVPATGANPVPVFGRPGAPNKPPTSQPPLQAAAERVDARYKISEVVRFVVRSSGSAPQDAAPVKRVEWTLSKDGLAPFASGTVPLENGQAFVEGKLDEPGFLQIRVKPEGVNSAVAALGAAAIEPEKITPSLPLPADFDAFWAGLKERLSEVPSKPVLTPVENPSKGTESFDLQIACLGAPVSGYYARPVGAAARSLPAILTVHGAGVRSSNRGASENWAAQGMLALDINAHGIPNARPEEFYKELSEGALKDYRVRGRDSRETIYFQGMFLRLVRALDFLCAQPEWNGRTLAVYGSSQGGAQALVAAGLDPRVSFFAAGVPAMCDHTGFKADRVNGWPKFIATGERPSEEVVSAVRYYDAVNFATRIKAPGIVTVGFVDVTCPPSSVFAAYNAIRSPKTIVEDPLFGHAVSQKASEAMRAAILHHVREGNPAR